MTKVLVLGANGQLARNTIPLLLQNPDIALTLYLRRAQRLRNPDPDRVAIVEGDVLSPKTLRTAMQGHDVVYANLAGDMADQARAIIEAMHATGVKRLIFISSPPVQVIGTRALLALGTASLMTPAYVALLGAAASLATLAVFDRR